MAVADAVAAEPDSVAMNDASETETAALPEPQPSIAEDKTNAATDQIGDLLTRLAATGDRQRSEQRGNGRGRRGAGRHSPCPGRNRGHASRARRYDSSSANAGAQA